MDRIKASAEHQETEEIREKAKIAVMIIIEKFSQSDIFQKEECQLILESYVEDLKSGMLFKIKKFLLPALIAMSKHLDQQTFVDKVYSEFIDFKNDDVWGVRKVCIENTSELIKYIDHTDIEKLRECFMFFKKSLSDPNRWVKN